MTCQTHAICVEDGADADLAHRLASEARAFVDENLGKTERPARVLFCATQECFANYGNPKVAALYFWGANTAVINETGWAAHILRHELIHHWQKQTFGMWKALRTHPMWYIEGMAYVLSKDPRETIPHPVAENQRNIFMDWVQAGANWRLPPKEKGAETP